MNKAASVSLSPDTAFAAMLSACTMDRSDEHAKTEILRITREYYTGHKKALLEAFRTHWSVERATHDMSLLLDDIISGLYGWVAGKTPNDPLAIIAVGGYGRGELFPYSDIDIVFLTEKDSADTKRITEFILYILWDMGLTVGQAVRGTADTLAKAKADITIRTTLLDARYLTGNRTLYEQFLTRFRKDIIEGSEQAFVEAKLAERDGRHLKCGDSRYVLEPNVKEGKGGLRDLHTIYWLAKYCYPITSVKELVGLSVFTREEYRQYQQAVQFLSLVRMHLHLLSGRAEERLTFDMQTAIAELMGYKSRSGARPVERFMKHYFQVARSVGNLTRTFCAVLEEEKKRKPRLRVGSLIKRTQKLGTFVIEGERLNVEHEDAFENDPVLLVELFHVAQENDLDIHPHALQRVSRNLHLITKSLQTDARANDIFMKIILSKVNPEITLRRMNEAGVLGKFIPDFGRVIGQMQYDMYHVFTVDEHTIFALSILHNIESGNYREELPLASDIVHLVESRRVLYLAVLCHDIAKGRGGDHSMLGETVAEKMAERFGFTPKERETTAWLVRHHLLMSRTAFKRDVNDPQTISDFVEKVQSPERLRLLLVLTVADIRAVGPTVWNGWKGALLRDLYYHAEEKMGARKPAPQKEQEEQLVRELLHLLQGWGREDVAAYVELGTPAFWSSMDPAGHARVARMMKEHTILQMPLTLDTYIDRFRAITEITICTPDQHGLFSKISGVMALCGANILNSKIFTLKNGVAVDTFWVQDAEGKAFDKPDKLARLSSQLEMVLSGRLDIDSELTKQKRPYPSRLEVFKVPAGVFIENKVSSQYTVVEVNGRDRIGFLHHVTRALADLGLTISTAHITTYGERAVDVFYVKDVFGMKIYHEGKLRQIRETLMQVLTAE